MAEYTMPAHGTFCWNELGTTDVEAAKKFYAELLGWQLKEGDIEGAKYNEIISAGRPVGGMYQTGPECPQALASPQWMPYVAVEDVDASARRVWELGGRVSVPPTDIPGVGRFCVVSDPAGAKLSLITLKGAHS